MHGTGSKTEIFAPKSFFPHLPVPCRNHFPVAQFPIAEAFNSLGAQEEKVICKFLFLWTAQKSNCTSWKLHFPTGNTERQHRETGLNEFCHSSLGPQLYLGIQWNLLVQSTLPAPLHMSVPARGAWNGLSRKRA